jgi:hypothetical protein
MQNGDMAGRIMAHAFNDELEKIAGSGGIRRWRRISAARESLGARVRKMPEGPEREALRKEHRTLLHKDLRLQGRLDAPGGHFERDKARSEAAALAGKPDPISDFDFVIKRMRRKK